MPKHVHFFNYQSAGKDIYIMPAVESYLMLQSAVSLMNISKHNCKIKNMSKHHCHSMSPVLFG